MIFIFARHLFSYLDFNLALQTFSDRVRDREVRKGKDVQTERERDSFHNQKTMYFPEFESIFWGSLSAAAKIYIQTTLQIFQHNFSRIFSRKIRILSALHEILR